ncbi:MchS3 family protein [Erwinia sp. ErVv1]|uniref:MchS3 family protein n=1 Tax=Erwinia sp. ErVv1 TaxID=1603299 RepID=UPI0012E86C15|nr:MchS3 family protein [Erwinia sp. ErVv1]
MKWTLLFMAPIMWSTIISATPHQEIELSSVRLFSIGFNGFVARKMPQQLIYEKALNRKNAIFLFEIVMESDTSTPESKAYAACGLWANKEAGKIKLKEKYNDLNVTVLNGDILRQETLGKIIKNIISNGCK